MYHGNAIAAIYGDFIVCCERHPAAMQHWSSLGYGTLKRERLWLRIQEVHLYRGAGLGWLDGVLSVLLCLSLYNGRVRPLPLYRQGSVERRGEHRSLLLTVSIIGYSQCR